MKNLKNYLLILIALIAGIMAFVISKSQLDTAYEKMNRGGSVEVVGPKEDMFAGDTIEEGDMGSFPMLKRFKNSRMITVEEYYAQKDLIIGHTLRRSVKAGEPLEMFDIDNPDLNYSSRLSHRITIGYRAVSIPVDTTSAVASLVRPNDHVDVLGTFRFTKEERTDYETVTLTVLQNITVLAVGQEMAGGIGGGRNRRAGRSSYSTVTLKVTPENAELLVFAQQKGRLTLTLRTRSDRKIIPAKDLKNVDFDTLQDVLRKGRK